MPITLTPAEKRNGLLCLAAHLFFLPGLISVAGDLLSWTDLQRNLSFYFINFTLVLWVFRRFLFGNLLVALDRLFPVVWYSILGYLGYQALGELLSILIYAVSPEFYNYNDLTVAAMVRQSPLLAVSIVALVPVAEETLYRGLLFRGLYEKKPLLAYFVSVTVFAAIHVAGYLGTLPPLHLLLSFLQYLPAGYCLCFAYRRSGTILSPILIHMAVNAMAVYAFVR